MSMPATTCRSRRCSAGNHADPAACRGKLEQVIAAMNRLSILMPVLLLLALAGTADAQSRPRTYVWGGIQYPKGHKRVPPRQSRLPVYFEVKRTPPQQQDSRVLVIRLDRPIVIERTRSSYKIGPRRLPRTYIAPRPRRQYPTVRRFDRINRVRNSGGVIHGGGGGHGHHPRARSRGRASRRTFPTSRFQIYSPRGRSRIYPAGRSRIYPSGR